MFGYFPSRDAGHAFVRLYGPDTEPDLEHLLPFLPEWHQLYAVEHRASERRGHSNKGENHQ